jgi:hypothetical protein
LHFVRDWVAIGDVRVQVLHVLACGHLHQGFALLDVVEVSL